MVEAHEPKINREFWMTIRQALLMVVAAIESACDVQPRTDELRKEAKRR